MNTQVVRHPKSIPHINESIKHDLLTVLQREIEALQNVTNNLPDEAVSLVELILQTSGRVVFSGMGKSGHIARKLAATFSSMGTPAFFLHPGEALHGDLGMVQNKDVFIALSKSGTGKELEEVFNVLRLQENKLVLICCSRGILASMVDLVVELPIEREACEMNLAPTSSSTVMIAFGDAVGITVSKMRGFEKNDFARTHPAGALGKRLLSTVQTYMHSGDDLPFVTPTTSFKDLIIAITSKKLGVAIVVENGTLCGIVTDGDLRRACEFGPALFNKTAAELMSKNPKTVEPTTKAFYALEIMEQFTITTLVVTKAHRVVGLVHIHDFVKAGIK
jgi:arabinose-5-phosphate isomerase